MKTFIYLAFFFVASVAPAQPVVINEVYGAGGNAGALFSNDYIELFNPGATPVDLGGWSVQYASATSTGTWQVTLLSGVIEPGRTFLIQEAGGAIGSALPIADVTGTLSMAATAGKVALLQSVTPLSGACPVSVLVIDRVGYGGTANCFEGTGPTPAPSAVLSAQRQTDGADSNNNASDFRAAAPTPSNSLPRSQVVTFSAIGSRVYGDASFVVTASASSGLPVVITSADPTIASVAGMTVTIVGAGDVDLTASQGGSGTFAPAAAFQTLHVAKAVLNATAVSTTRPAGAANPPFQIQYSGLVGSDTKSVLDVPPIASCAANMSSLPGDYPITVTGGVDNNYQFAYSPGVLTILPSSAGSPSYLISPTDGALDLATNPSVKCAAVAGATTWFIQASADPSFVTFVEFMGGRVQTLTGLSYGTVYHARVRTDLSAEFGRVTRFTTGNPAQFAVLKSPSLNTPGVGLSPSLIFADVPGATVYTFEMSPSPGFTSNISGQGPRSQAVAGLEPGTTYFVRVKTDLSAEWGPVRTFHTAPLAELCFVRYPGERFSQVSWLPEFALNDVGAPAYVMQISEGADFASATEFGPVGIKFAMSEPLKYRTRYYTRVRPADAADNWGPVRSFTTSHPADFSMLRTPADGSEGVDTLARLVLFQVPGATGYELSMSTGADFTVDEVVRDASERSLRLALHPFTTYFARVRTNLSLEWGKVTRFTTSSAGKAAASSREATTGGLAAEDGIPETLDLDHDSAKAFPNPFPERTTLCPGQPVFLTVSDLQGRVIFSGRVSAHECCELGAGWSPGIYLATLITRTGRRTIRLVKSP